MSEQHMHTPGPLTAMLKPRPSYSDHGWRAIATCGSQWMLGAPASNAIQVENNVVVAGWGNEANARRLAACWNACQGLSTEQIETIDGLMPAKLSYQVMQRDRDELLAVQTMGVELNTPDFLDWIADRLVHVHAENPNVDFVLSLRERAKFGRAAVANATGGAA